MLTQTWAIEAGDSPCVLELPVTARWPWEAYPRRTTRVHNPLAAMQKESNTPGQSVRRRATDHIRPALLHDSRPSLAIALMLTLLLPTAFGQTFKVLLERVGQWPGQDEVPGLGVAVAGSYAYLASGTNGLHVVDVSDPANPRRVGSCDTPGSAWGVTVTGHYAYVADYYGGLQVIDVSDPANPQRVGGYRSGVVWDVAVSGQYAYVASEDAGLQIIDVSDPTRPRRVGGYDTRGKAWRVAVSGQYAYVADDTGGLQIIDVSNPANPRRVGGYHSYGSALGVAVSGSYAYVGYANRTLQVFDVSDPVNPQVVGSNWTRGLAVNVAVRDPYVYVADGPGGLQVFDVSNPATPWHVGEFWGANTGFFERVVLSGEYIYAANWVFGLQVFRIRPASPRLEGPLWLSAEGFQVWLYAPVVGTYRLEFSEDLESWKSLRTLSNVIGRLEFWDRSATSAVHRFYRAVRIR